MRVYRHHGKWCLDYQWEGKRYRYPVSELKRIADEAAANVVVQMAAGTFKGPSRKHADPETTKGAATFGKLCTEFLALKKHGRNKSTVEFYNVTVRVIRKHFKERTYLRDITPKQCELFFSKRRKNGAVATGNRSLYVLQAMFRKAVEWEWLPRSPAAGLRLVKERPRERYLNPEEANRLLEHADDWLRPILRTFLYTGARRGDLLGHPLGRGPLMWKDVDLAGATITFRQTKEGKERRLPIPADLVETLKRLPMRLKGGAVFRDRDGEQVKPERVLNRFKAAAKAAKIENHESLRLHDLRHTAASWMVQRGVPLFEVAKVLGHHTIQMTERYSHFASGHLTNAVNTLAATLNQTAQK
jgi:integrase